MTFAGDDPEIELVVAGELSLLDPEVRRSRAASSALLDEQFHEFGYVAVIRPPGRGPRQAGVDAAGQSDSEVSD